MQLERLLQALIIFLLVSLSGCSGGSLDSETDQPDPPVLVNAGPNQTVNEQVVVTLNASAQGQTATLTYAWSVSPVLTIEQAATTSPEATFTTPTLTEERAYTFTLIVTDENGNQGTDSVIYRVLPLNESPNAFAEVVSPVIAQGARFPAGVEIILDAQGSNDPDAADILNPIAAWKWQQTAGTEVLSDVSLDGDSIAFISPILDDPSDLSFSLTVTDQEGATDEISLTLGILSASQTQPTVDAGQNHQVYSGEIILLTGDAQTSIPAGRPLVYSWLNDSELVPTIINRSAERTHAIAPLVTSEQLITFTLSVSDTFGNQVDDSITVRVKPLPIRPVNDSGVTLQASMDTIGTSHQADFPAQDGQRGKDIISENGLLEKAGRGEQGFDFTRLDAIGDEQDDINQAWSCVRDNNTGLVWEVKTDSGLHNSEHSYAWFQDENNGGFEGSIGSPGLTCGIAQCNTQAFVAQVNAQGLCNFFDWRLPTHDELLSILHFGNVTGSRIDVGYFPNTDDFATSPLWYWTNQPGADGVSEEAQTAWAIDFSSGNDNFLNKSTIGKVRLVRGGR